MAIWRILGIITLLLFGGFAIGGPARAALILESSPVYGPNSLVLGTSTALEWLNLKLSRDLTPASVETQFAPGGEFAGFRYATNGEVTSLITSFFGGPVCCVTPINLAKTIDFANLFGPTATFDGLPFLDGFFGPFPDNFTICTNSFFYQIGPAAGNYDQDCGSNIFRQSATQGSWLVRAAAIPEPASITLLGTGLLVALLVRRRKIKARAL